MGSEWVKDKSIADRAMPAVRAALSQVLLIEGDTKEDQEENTDLRVLTINGARVAVRIRNGRYAERYSNQFTIRASRPSGMKSEFTKIMEGWGDMIFYGFSDDTGCNLIAWFIGDLSIFRNWLCFKKGKDGKWPGECIPNTDRSSDFYVFKIEDVKGYRPFVLKQKKLGDKDTVVVI